MEDTPEDTPETSDELEAHALAQELIKVNGHQVWVRRMLRENFPLTGGDG